MQASAKDVGPAARKKLSGLVKYYMSKPHPFTACVRDNTKRFGKDRAERVCAVLKDIGTGTTKWRNQKGAIDALLAAADNDYSGLIDMFTAEVTANLIISNAPNLTTVPNVQIVKTGIEYPLSTGPATFTPEDLADAVEAQKDPAIPQPRVWIGHPDDERIHGKRTDGPPSGEPAVGTVTNMRLSEDGHTIVGDLAGVPIWLADILGSAFPSRSIEGRFNFHTPTGKKWRLVISGLALLGVVWPGVGTLDDIQTLYSKEGPDVKVHKATPAVPITIAAASSRQVEGRFTVEDLRRKFYEMTATDDSKRWWWLRAIYIDPNELIVDNDEGGLLRMPFKTEEDKIEFGEVEPVKLNYVNAAQSGIVPQKVNEGRQYIAQFSDRSESKGEKTISIKLFPNMTASNEVTISITKEKL